MTVTATTAVPLQERIYRTEAIVLNRLDYREADRIITVYTPERGKIRVIAKGVRRPLSRLGPHLEYFTRCRLMLAAGRELDTVTGAETVDPHLGLRSDLDAYGHASHMVEVLNRLTEDREAHQAVYDLLGSSLRLLADGLEPFIVTRHYEWALLTLLGFRPELYHCLHCQSELVAVPNAFSSRLGGMLCPRCRGADSGSREISINAQKFLRGLDRQGLSFVARLPLIDTVRTDVDGVMATYLRHVADTELRSLTVWRAIRDPEPRRPSSR